MMRFWVALFAAIGMLWGADGLVEEYLSDRNLWLSTYKNHQEYERLSERITVLSRQIAQMGRRGENVRALQEELTLLEARHRLYDSLPRSFVDVVDIPLPEVERIDVNLISYLTKSHNREFERARDRYRTLNREYLAALVYLEEYEGRVQTALAQNETPELAALLQRVQTDRRYFELAQSLLEQKQTAIETLKGMLEAKMRHYRDHDLIRLAMTALVTVLILALLWLSRRLLGRYVLDEERLVFWHKATGALAIAAIALFFLFNYIDNLLYALTFVGFVAAALTIVMKEAVLNLAAWLQLVFGSTIRVGDRILLYHEVQPIIGDVIAISPMRMTLYEEITHNNATEIKRAGRVIFIPNNYLFTKAIYNYTHDTMKTLYDLIEVPLGFESNFEKARAIAEETVEALTGRYIEMARRQYDRLRDRYALRGKNLGPRIQFMMNKEGSGIVLFLWYVAPYREILSCRSDITLTLIERFRAEPDIILSGDKKTDS